MIQGKNNEEFNVEIIKNDGNDIKRIKVKLFEELG